MQVVRKPWFIPALLTLVIVGVGALLIGKLLPQEDIVAEGEIRSQLEDMYNGTVESLTMGNGVYDAKIMRNGAVYAAEIDVVTGSVRSLVQTGGNMETSQQVLSEKVLQDLIYEKYSGEVENISLDKRGEAPVYEIKISKEQKLTTIKMDAYTGEVISEKVDEATVENVIITKQQAIKIAHGKLKGEVEYVTFKQTDDGGHYLIEIDGEQEEAVFQIHAISGKILSITWDD